MKIVLLGSGNVATQLGKALQAAEHEILFVWSRTEANAKALASKLDTKFSTEIEEISSDAGLYLLSVSDDVIGTIARNVFFENKVLVHTSGASGINISNIAGVFYPVQTFSKQRDIDISGIPIVVEGIDSQVIDMLVSLGKSISSNVQIADSGQRKALHVAAVFANNFSNHLFAVAEQILIAKGLDINLIRPLILETAQKVQQLNPELAQTGPAARNDRETINSHLEFLSDNNQLKELYSLLSQSIINLNQKP